MGSGHTALLEWAPHASLVLEDVVDAAWSAADSDGFLPTVVDAARRTAAIHDLAPLVPPSGTVDDDGTDGVGPGRREALLAFAVQCATDVSAVTPDQRAAFLAAAGQGAGNLAAALWVVEFVPRTRAALDALFGSGDWPGPRSGRRDDLWAALDALIRAVPALDALDPVTSELVRLRGARQHDCRLCRSLRSRPALRAGADETVFAAVDEYRGSALTQPQQSALALTDAMIWTPGRIGRDIVAEVQVWATPAQQVELVLDVTRNALNKVAVGLGADAAHVEDGVEIYDVEPDGSLVYGVSAD